MKKGRRLSSSSSSSGSKKKAINKSHNNGIKAYDNTLARFNSYDYWVAPGTEVWSPVGYLGSRNNKWKIGKASNRGLHKRIKDIRNSLDYSTYKSFYSCYKRWRKGYGKNYKWGFNWMDPINDCCCDVAPTMPECMPGNVLSYGSLVGLLQDLGIHSMFGPQHDEQAQAICDVVGDDDPVCCYMRSANASFPLGTGEVSVKQMYHMFQIAYDGKFSPYSEVFASETWAEPQLEFDLSTNSILVTNQLVDHNTICNEETNQAWYNLNVPGNAGYFRWQDGRTHTGVVGDEDSFAFGILRG